MDDFFQLLSSMSPKLKNRQKTLKKAVTVLALKKHFRRSYVYEKCAPVNNEDLAVVETDSSSSTKSSTKNSNKCNKNRGITKDKINHSNGVLIIDSTDSEDSNNPLEDKPNKSSPSKNSLEKQNDVIQKWLNNIDRVEKSNNVTFFSQVSTIYNENETNFNPEGNGYAASSTFCDHITKRFDEMFLKNHKAYEEKVVDETLDDSFSLRIDLSLDNRSAKKEPYCLNFNKNPVLQNKNIEESPKSAEKEKVMQIIDETLLTSDESFNNKSFGSLQKIETILDHTPERQCEEFITTRKRQNVRFQIDLQEQQISCNGSMENTKEMETMLDSLYGNKWREKQNHVLTMSEPRKNLSLNHKVNTNSERRPDFKLNSETGKNKKVRDKPNFDRLKTPLKSPWMDRLKGLCDSDSDSNTENENTKTSGIQSVKTRLFCEDSPINIKNDNDIEEDKENLDFSYLAESLEDRIRKKMNSTKPNKKIINENKILNDNILSNPKILKTQAPKKPLGENFNFDNFAKPNNEENYKENGKKLRKIKTKSKSKKNSKNRSSSDSSNDIENEILEISSDEEYDREITKILKEKRKSFKPEIKDGCYSFLESLSANVPINKCIMSARVFRTSFKSYKNELVKKLFTLYNEKVFENLIPHDSEIEWNDKLRNTAGLCYCKKITHRSGKVVRQVKISLSTKVLDTPDRVRDTLIHEMCHAATWIVNQVSNGHGIYWKNWAFKAMRVFPELPPIKRCHTYTINTKYTYRCTKCGYSIGRHTKSLNIERKVCGFCRGKFEVLINKTTKNGETKSVPVTPKKDPSGFALFVKENYALYKEPSKKHGDVMKILGQKFSELKVKNGV